MVLRLARVVVGVGGGWVVGSVKTSTGRGVVVGIRIGGRVPVVVVVVVVVVGEH